MNHELPLRRIFLAAVLLVIAAAACQPAPIPISGPLPQSSDDNRVYLPSLMQAPAPTQPPAPTASGPLIHLPYITDYEPDSSAYFSRTSIFWFGRVLGRENYADVRLAYNPTSLTVAVTVIDRMVWFDTSPAAAEFSNWDSISLYIDPTGTQASAPPAASAVRLDAQLAENFVTNRLPYQAAYRWNSTAWSAQALNFSTTSVIRGQGFNDPNLPAEGYVIQYTIPYESLGLSGPPASGKRMLLAVALHDRDAPDGSPQPDKVWPSAMQTNRTNTWGRISFDLPTFTPPNRPQTGQVTIRHGLNGAVVPDGAVGGGTECGGSLNYWTEWGEAVYNSPDHTSVLDNSVVNVMNQRDVSDFPCFSKYYVTFPLTQVPAGKVILSAELSLWQLGSAGDGYETRGSIIQAIGINEDINPNTLSWNNAPLAQENYAQTWVEPLLDHPGWANLPEWKFNLSRAVDAAYRQGQPLRLVFYTADAAQHSGKYFYPAESDCNQIACPRPTLRITWGNP